MGGSSSYPSQYDESNVYIDITEEADGFWSLSRVDSKAMYYEHQKKKKDLIFFGPPKLIINFNQQHIYIKIIFNFTYV